MECFHSIDLHEEFLHEPAMGLAIRSPVMRLVLMFLLVSGNNCDEVSRTSFPGAFVFGTASSAYQYEGAVFEDGRWPSIWDTFSHIPGKVKDGSNGDVAINQYHLYEGDIEMMAEVGMDAYRFSISWSRLIPEGRGSANPRAVHYYNDLINGLLKHGIEPHVTLNHYDLPQVLHDEYGGWLNSQIVDDFADYAEVCFELFGDRVKHWITINEPGLKAALAYDLGIFPPGRCSAPFGNCSVGNSTTEPYIVAHYQILSHAAAVKKFRNVKALRIGSMIGISVSAMWYEPLTNSSQDVAAVSRMLDFTVGWTLDPIFYGDYPATMRHIVGSRLPRFSKQEVSMVKGSVDFVGLNHYTTLYVADVPRSSNLTDYFGDRSIRLAGIRDGVPIGQLTAFQSSVLTFYIVPRGIKRIVEYIKLRYHNPPVFITENGMAYANNDSIPLEEALNDTTRVTFHQQYLSSLSEAVKDGADVKGYFVWSLADNFEFGFGYSLRFGILYVDFTDPNLKRYKKMSALWFEQFLSKTTQEDEDPSEKTIGTLMLTK